LTPEEFIGPDVKLASGVSNEEGICWFQSAGEELPGVNPGIFRIEVSKTDAGGKELLPARYNTNTTLGADTGDGSSSLQEGSAIILNLSFR
jgi:hypothetical protein